MISSSYTDSRLAAIYDTLNPPGPGNAFYTELAGDRLRGILDVGCGTGWLACDLAALGHSVTGVDPSDAMLEIARHRPGAERVKWIKGGATELSLEHRFDLIIMTGHAFQVLLSDRDILAALRTLRDHLAPAGQLAFETRNRAVCEWVEWTPAGTLQTVSVPGVGNVEVHNDIRSVNGNIVTYETHFKFGSDDIKVAADSIRFMEQDELSAFLAAADFHDVTWFGNWDRSDIDQRSPELIVTAK